MKSTLKS